MVLYCKNALTEIDGAEDALIKYYQGLREKLATTSIPVELERNRRALSFLAYVFFLINESPGVTTIMDRSKTLQRLTGGIFENIYIWGSFYPMDLSGTKFYTSWFIEYDSLINCYLADAQFQDCILSLSAEMENSLENSNSPKRGNKCRISDASFSGGQLSVGIKKLIASEKNSTEFELDNLKADMNSILRKFYSVGGDRFLPIRRSTTKVNIKSTYKFEFLFGILIGQGALCQSSNFSEDSYELSSDYKVSVKNWVQNGHLDRKMRGLLQNFVTEIQKRRK